MEDLRQPTSEEADELTKDLQEVLKKHDAELGVKANIELLIRTKGNSVPSPFMPKPDGESSTNQETPQTN